MSKAWRGLILVLILSCGCVFDSGPELPQLPPFPPPNNTNNTNNTNNSNNSNNTNNTNNVDPTDMGDMDIVDMMMPSDMPADMVLAPDMPDEMDMPADMMVEQDMAPDMEDPFDMMSSIFGDVCPGSFEPPPAPPLCDLVAQNCSMAASYCDIALVGNSPPTFEPRCFADGQNTFLLDEGDMCDPTSSTDKCRKGLECSQIGGENRCRRFCILEDARGCDPNVATSFCASTGLSPLDDNGIGFCANACDAF